MNRGTFGEVLSLLRKDLVDLKTGKAWTQTALAQAAGLSERVVGAIERGEKVKLDGETLFRLADALQLTVLERREFFAAAQEVDFATGKLLRNEQCTFSLQMLESLHLPAFVCDPVYNLVYLNRQIGVFHGLDYDELQAAARQHAPMNVLQEIFSPGSSLRHAIGESWREVALANLQHFRATSLRYRHTQRFQQVIDALQTLPDFALLWPATAYPLEADNSQLHIFHYEHNVYKNVHYLVTRTTLFTKSTELHLSILMPGDERTARLFLQFGTIGASSEHLTPLLWLPDEYEDR